MNAAAPGGSSRPFCREPGWTSLIFGPANPHTLIVLWEADPPADSVQIVWYHDTPTPEFLEETFTPWAAAVAGINTDLQVGHDYRAEITPWTFNEPGKTVTMLHTYPGPVLALPAGVKLPQQLSNP
jgi:hypothetical protein